MQSWQRVNLNINDKRSNIVKTLSAELASSSDNKTAVYALMDKINFDRQRYRLGHTIVFFRAGALVNLILFPCNVLPKIHLGILSCYTHKQAGLEEERDELVIKLVRKIQGEVLKRVRGYVFGKKRDQRELIKVGQRNFRKYMSMRDWGWFVIIQKTRYIRCLFCYWKLYFISMSPGLLLASPTLLKSWPCWKQRQLRLGVNRILFTCYVLPKIHLGILS